MAISNVVLVTDEQTLIDQVVTLLKAEVPLDLNDIQIVCLDSIDQLRTEVENGLQVACVTLQLPEKDPVFDKAVGKLKRFESLKFVPFIGLHPKQKIKAYSTRRHFFHILDKDHYEKSLPHTIESALSDFSRYQELLNEVSKRTSAIGLIQSGNFTLQTLEEAEALTVMLSNACPDPHGVALGLSELLVNAIEHGNLEISFEEKTKLLEAGEWENEVAKRLSMAKYKSKFVTISFEKKKTKISFEIEDEGDGFDWSKYIGKNETNITRVHGRGISLACSMAFSNLSYNAKGNKVTVWIDL